MRFKLDENLGPRLASIFTSAGHDCMTVRDQDLGGCSDEELMGAVVTEARILVTNDFDFADPLHYPPERSAGIAVLNAKRPTFRLLERLVSNLLAALAANSISGKLWIVEPTRIREHESKASPGEAP